MAPNCVCGRLGEDAGRPAACHECGTAGCASCAIVINGNSYCRWCANWVADSA